MTLSPHSVPWYSRLSTMQKGYFYPWRSTIGARHGEDVFPELVFEHLRPELDVLEVACAQGNLTLEMAPRCRSVLGYDATADYIDLARAQADARGVSNTTFVVHNSSAAANGGSPRLPVEDHSIDLFVNSKGPFHWFSDAARVARPGAAILMLVPDMTPLEPWTDLLPEIFRWPEPPDWARSTIEGRLGEAGLRLHSWWSFEVPELFLNPQELYVWRSWGFAPDEVPTFEECAPGLEQIFKEFAGPEGLAVRYRRHMWKAVLPINR